MSIADFKFLKASQALSGLMWTYKCLKEHEIITINKSQVNLSNSIEIVKTDFRTRNLKLMIKIAYITLIELSTGDLNKKLQLNEKIHYLWLQLTKATLIIFIPASFSLCRWYLGLSGTLWHFPNTSEPLILSDWS